MTELKTMHEDCRGEVFSTKVMVRYPRKTMILTEINRSKHIINDEKTMVEN